MRRWLAALLILTGCDRPVTPIAAPASPAGLERVEADALIQAFADEEQGLKKYKDRRLVITGPVHEATKNLADTPRLLMGGGVVKCAFMFTDDQKKAVEALQKGQIVRVEAECLGKDADGHLCFYMARLLTP